jgi:hypothetical protein
MEAEQYPKSMVHFYQTMRKEIPENDSFSKWLYTPLIPLTYNINILYLTIRNTKIYISENYVDQ